jgi:internalin A
LIGLGLQKLPESIGRLERLQSLDVDGNRLAALPESIGQLAQLQSLGVSYNSLAALPEWIDRLVQLKFLDVKRNVLAALPEWIGRLERLQSLDVDGNRLAALPESIGRLARLQSLGVRRNYLKELPESIGQLAQLQSLGVSYNGLAALPESIRRLVQLQFLDIRRNVLAALPEWIGRLARLRSLDVGGNRLAALPESIGRLAQLQFLDASGNQLQSLPNALSRMRGLEEIFLHDNTRLGLPPEVLGPTSKDVSSSKAMAAKPADILDYYFRLRGGKRQLNEAKLILVGRGGAGKTSLVNCLLGYPFDPHESKTEGIRITPWTVEVGANRDSVQLNIWDFGGQEIMHATHQFFLTQRSLYLLVINAREGEQDANVEYWLRMIESFGAESPVIVVINKVKDHPFDLNRRGLMEKFPAVRAFAQTDCKDEIGLDELHWLIREETDRLEHLRDPFPAAWFKIKSLLANLEENYIPYEKYRELCKANGEPDQRGQDTLVGFLHHLGIVLNFKDDPRLHHTHVLKPEWVTSAIYTLLNSPTLTKSQGDLRFDQLTELLDPNVYPREVHGYLMDLMGKFELCFEFEGNRGHYLIPELLGKEEPPWREDFPPERCLNFEYHYNILPEGLIPRFIVRTHEWNRDLSRWRSGVVLERDGNRALVRADVQDREVFLSVNGPESGRRRLLEAVRGHFDVIHRSIAKLQAVEKVPVPGRPHIVLDYRKLLVREANGKTEVEIEDGDKVIEIPLRKLLEGIESAQSREERRIRQEGVDDKGKHFHFYSGSFPVLEGDSVEHIGRDKSTVNIKDSTLTNSPVAIRQKLENSYNTAQQASNDALQPLLKQLCDETAKLLEKIDDPKKAENVKDDLDSLVKEAAKPEPRRKWLEVSRDGLVDAAKTVGEMAGPIISVVEKILALVP